MGRVYKKTRGRHCFLTGNSKGMGRLLRIVHDGREGERVSIWIVYFCCMKGKVMPIP